MELVCALSRKKCADEPFGLLAFTSRHHRRGCRRRLLRILGTDCPSPLGLNGGSCLNDDEGSICGATVRIVRSTMTSDEREIRTVHSSWIDGVNTGDLARLLTLRVSGQVKSGLHHGIFTTALDSRIFPPIFRNGTHQPRECF